MEEPYLRFACPHCHGVLRARKRLAGQWAKCKQCDGRIMIPFKSEAPLQSVVPTTGATNHQASSTESVGSVEEMCSICQCSVEIGADRTTCDRCGLPFHKDCWQENQGCSAYGCANVNLLKPNGPDITIGPFSIPGSEHPPPLPVITEFPWEYLLLAASAVSVVISVFTFGIASLSVGIVGLAYLSKHSYRGSRWLTALSLGVAAIGFLLGVWLSCCLYL